MSTRTWSRSAIPTRCGRCGELINKGDPVLLIAMVPRASGRALRFVRCGACEGPAPPDLPPLVERAPIAPSALHRVGSLLPFGREPVNPRRVDWKTRAAEGAEREPGEDG